MAQTLAQHAPQAATRDDQAQMEKLKQAALSFDWDSGDLKQLGWIMSKLGLDLGTAVRVFLNGNPDAFNYCDPDEIRPQDTARVALLDCLHMKIGYGYYLPDPKSGLSLVRSEAEDWIARQKLDRARGIKGRWIFNAAHFAAVSDEGPRQIVMTPQARRKSTLWKTIFVPMWQRS